MMRRGKKKSEIAQDNRTNRVLFILMRGLLFLISLSLLCGRSIVSFVASFLAILIMYYSGMHGVAKEFIWAKFGYVTLPISALAWLLHLAHTEFIDEDRAYVISVLSFVAATGIEFFSGGIILTVLLILHLPKSSSKRTPPSWNKHIRDIVKLLLAVTGITLILGYPSFSLSSSLLSIVVLRYGKWKSIKNLIWMEVVWFSFPASAIVRFMRFACDQVDERKAYSLKILVYSGARGIELVFGVVILVVLMVGWYIWPS